tara:strand:- start:6474 stop:7088 length:615 start_codon:yes stop_codon:yes gene_type:complete
MNSLSGLILAAGCSTRMGQSKPLLDWYGQTLIEYQIKIFNYLSIQPIVILGFQSEMIIKKIKKLSAKIVINQNYDEGKSSSVLLGINSLKSNSDLLLLSVDQPRPKKMIEQIIKSHKESNALITVPKYNKKGILRGGHPIIIGNKIINNLSEFITTGKTVKDFVVSQNTVNELIFDDILIRLDLNDKDDYHEAIRLFENYGNNK